MKGKLTRRSSIAAIAALGVLASLGSAPAANAQELSPGCQALNDPKYDARYAFFPERVDGGVFAAGDRITITASDSSAGKTLGFGGWVKTGPGPYDETPLETRFTGFPGTIEYTIPAAGEYISLVWAVLDAEGNGVEATFEVSCASSGPDCTGVTASPSVLKADGKLQQVSLAGATDVDNEALTYSISRATQDEPTTGGFRNDLKTPDAGGISTNTVSVRGERNPSLNGRVYRIHYTVTDASGFECSSFATVGVPARKGIAPVDDGTQASWNSFTGALIQ